MPRLFVDGSDLVVGLSWLEKLGAVHRNVRIPLRAVVGRRPAVRVELTDEAPYAQLLVSVSDAESTLAAIHGATGI